MKPGGKLFADFDKGPWEIGETADGRLFLQSDDMTYDVRLYISGDFPREADTEYANALAALLNAERP
jgi:hypothetical protein